MAPRNTRTNPETQVRSPSRSFLQQYDNFYAPARDRRGPAAIQRGISDLSGVLEERFVEARGEQRDAQFQEGVQDALREQAGQEIQGVQTGGLFRQNSRFYMAGLNETRGTAAAAQFSDQLAIDYNNWDGRHTDDDGSATRAWLNERVGTFVNQHGDNQYFLAGALPRVQAAANNIATTHSARTNERLETESREGFSVAVADTWNRMAMGEMEPDEALEVILGMTDDAYNMEGRVANDDLVSTAINYAGTHSDPSAIFMLAEAHDSGRLVLNPQHTRQLRVALDGVEADIARQEARGNALADAELEAARQASNNAYLEELRQDPTALPSWDPSLGTSHFSAQLRLRTQIGELDDDINVTGDLLAVQGLEAGLSGLSSYGEKTAFLSDFIDSHRGVLTRSQVMDFQERFSNEEDSESIINHRQITTLRSDASSQVAGLIGAGSNGSYMIGNESFVSSVYDGAYNTFATQNEGDFDTGTRAGRIELHEAASEHAMTRVVNSFQTEMAAVFADPTKARIAAQLGLTRVQYQEASQADSEAAATAPPPEEDNPFAPEPSENDVDLPEGTTLPQENSGETSLLQDYVDEFSDGVTEAPAIRRIDPASNPTSSSGVNLGEDPEFIEGVNGMSERLGIDPEVMLGLMDFETGGSFGTGRMNPQSDATGLIGFLGSTAEDMGYSLADLEAMDRTEQLGVVEEYFENVVAARGPIETIDDAYMAILWPRAVGQPDDYVLFREGSEVYARNAGLDVNGNGTVTKSEAAILARERYEENFRTTTQSSNSRPDQAAGGESLMDSFVNTFTDGVDERPDISESFTGPAVGEGPMTIHEETRATIPATSSRPNISMDFNASDEGGARGTEVIIPDNHTPEMRAAAERFNNLVAEFAAANGINDYPIRGVRTTSENGRGMRNTIHAEPFFNDDPAMQAAIQANPAAFAAIYQEAFGSIPGNLVAPHGVGNDRGAVSSVFGDETSFGELMARSLMQNGNQTSPSNTENPVTTPLFNRVNSGPATAPAPTPSPSPSGLPFPSSRPSTFRTRGGTTTISSGVGVTPEVQARVSELAPDPARAEAITAFISENPDVDWMPVQGPNGEIMLVSNDFLRNENGDYIRASHESARDIAESHGARLPRTSAEVDAIENGADMPVDFISSRTFMGGEIYPGDVPEERLNEAHTRALAAAGITVGRGNLAAGHLKTVMHNGGIYLRNIQPNRVAHGRDYADYSQGVRLIAPVTF